ncbi:MAG: FecCD family ABC transporter permease [Candidatus Azotimanducaceae bacterium]|uniref:Iron ABC transporter n=1 Tax=OM182 bacterium TaxID=2510334 RepID=A0A520S1R3_9GAMM|nr:iron ABC transporter [Gammaproteobacteria bacterium]RZO76402.1 MAG: iron ABC transporter [OM182 bacterium]
MSRGKVLNFSLLIICLLAGLILSLSVGAAKITLVDIRAVLQGFEVGDLQKTIILDIRLPRILLAIFVGGGIGASGAAIQGLFRNPLADPALIGVSSGAALFAALYLVVGSGFFYALSGLAASAFLGGLLTTCLVLEVGRRGGTISAMLLAGIAINAIAIACIGLLSYISTDMQLRGIAFWALGSLSGADWNNVYVASAIPIIVLALSFESARLNAITLGEKDAIHLGISIAGFRIRIVLLTALAVSIGVALTGVIAFIGLVVPHLIRLTMGSMHQTVIPASALLGGLLLLVADTASRTLLAPAELPVGILTALMGGPFFVLLVMRKKGRLGI